MSKPTDLHELITSIQDGHEMVEFHESENPHLGLFYVIDEKLYWEGVPLESIQDSYHYRIYPKMHPTFWNDTILKNRPELNKFDAYYFPRGRVVYDKKLSRYELVADKCIIRKEKIVSRIIIEMKLPRKHTEILGDPHYECFKCKAEKISKLESELEKLAAK